MLEQNILYNKWMEDEQKEVGRPEAILAELHIEDESS